MYGADDSHWRWDPGRSLYESCSCAKAANQRGPFLRALWAWVGTGQKSSVGTGQYPRPRWADPQRRKYRLSRPSTRLRKPSEASKPGAGTYCNLQWPASPVTHALELALPGPRAP